MVLLAICEFGFQVTHVFCTPERGFFRLTRKVADKTAFKLVLLGDSSVGKSSIVCRFVKNQFHENEQSTVGEISVEGSNNSKVKFSIWDTAGQERFAPLAPMYYRGANAALVVFDIVSEATFKKAQFWVQELQVKGSPNVVIALAGNKIDLAQMRQVSKQDAQQFANTNGILYFETSAKTGENVNSIFTALAKKLQVDADVKPIGRGDLDGKIDLEPAARTNEGCCG